LPGSTENGSHVLKLTKNNHRLKQAGWVWNQYLHKALMELKYVQSKIDSRLYYRAGALLAIYIVNCTLIAEDKQILLCKATHCLRQDLKSQMKER